VSEEFVSHAVCEPAEKRLQVLQPEMQPGQRSILIIVRQFVLHIGINE
jgi:hypothetical protein